MGKKSYDILSWTWLALSIILFTSMVNGVNSAPTDLFDKYGDSIDSGNFSEMDEAMENLMNEDAFGKIDHQVNNLKYILYGLGTIYSIIIFALCFKLKVGTLEKGIILIGGIMTYGGVALFLYFFEERKKFSSGDTQLVAPVQ